MHIVKPMQAGVLHRTFKYQNKHYLTVTALIPFSTTTLEAILEQQMWETICDAIPDGLFDSGMPKKRGEFLVAGHFFSNSQQPVEQGIACVNVGGIKKEILVSAPRFWHRTGSSYSFKNKITKQPIDYKFAFGGENHKRNPKGIGKSILKIGEQILHPLPQLEYPNDVISRPGAEIKPVSFGRIDWDVDKRLKYAGTYDENYIKQAMPGLPDDINFCYFNDASPDQWFPGYLRGNEQFEVYNMHPTKAVLKGHLPPLYSRVFIQQTIQPCSNRYQDSHLFSKDQLNFKEIKTHLDTLWLFPEFETGIMVFRGTTDNISPYASDVKSLLIAIEDRNEKRKNTEHYQQQVIKRTDPNESYKHALNSKPLIPASMTCGFKKIQEREDFPLSLEMQNNLKQFAEKNKDQTHLIQKEKIEDLANQLKKIGVDPTKLMTSSTSDQEASEKLKKLLENLTPGVSGQSSELDIGRIDFSAMDEVKELAAELKDKQVANLKCQIQEQINQLRNNNQSKLFKNQISTLQRQLQELDLPPLWPRTEFTKHIESITEQKIRLDLEYKRLKQLGVTEQDLPKAKINLDLLKNQLLEVEKKAKETYRQGAHLLEQGRSPLSHTEKTHLQKKLQSYSKNKTMFDALEFTSRDLSGLDLSGLDLKKINFSHSYLEGTVAVGTHFDEANLSFAVMVHSDIECSKLNRINANRLNIGGSNLSLSELNNVKFTEAELQGIKLDNTQLNDCLLKNQNWLNMELISSQFNSSQMQSINIVDCKLYECQFKTADLTHSNWIKPNGEQLNFIEADLTTANLIEANWPNSDFSRTRLENTRFVGRCNFSNSNFSNVNANKACFKQANLFNCTFTHSSLSESDLSETNLTHACFYKSRSVSCMFDGSFLVSADFRQSNLMSSSFFQAWLEQVDFTQSNLFEVNFYDSHLADNSFTLANLDRTILQDWRPL